MEPQQVTPTVPPPPVVVEQKPPRSNKTFKILLLVFLVLLLGAVITYGFQNYSTQSQSNTIQLPEDVSVETPTPTPSIELDFIWELPKNWTLEYSLIENEKGEKVGELFGELYSGITQLKSKQTCQTILISRLNHPLIEIISSKNYSTETYPNGYFILSKVGLDQKGPPYYWYPRSYCLQSNNKAFLVSFYDYEQVSNNDAIFDQILSSFRFVEEETWVSYSNKSFGLEMKIPMHMKVINEDANKVELGFSPERDEEAFPYLEISKAFSEDATKLPSCLDAAKNCLDNWEHDKEPSIEDVEVDGVIAKSFYITYGVDSSYHFIQTNNPTLEFKMYVAGGGLDQTFNRIISSVDFTN